MAFQAAYKAFTDPESVIRNMSQEQKIEFFSMCWAYYRSTMFSRRDDVTAWVAYLAARELYKHTRLIYNPVPQIVDFYVDNIWQPANDPVFESLVTPLTNNTDDKIKGAVAQLDQWGNWLSDMQIVKRYAAATGNVLIEGIDDLDREKVTHKTIWPGYVKELELSASGDVLAYTLEYDVWDSDLKKTYRYKQVVDKEKRAYFRNDKPFVPPGQTEAVEENPYGFVFAVWIKHNDDGADNGLPACKDYNKIDNVNSLASHLDDYIHKAIESPKVISTKGEIVPIIGGTRNKETGIITPEDPRLNWVVLKTEEGASVSDLSGLLDITAASPELKRQLDSFENDYPELQANSIIRENSQLSGAALERMLGPAQNRLDGVQSGYNNQLTKLRQMGIAVAGMRTKDWKQGTKQQSVFAPFNLDSYSQGQLDFHIKRSVLVQNTEVEDAELYGKKLDNVAKATGILPLDDRLMYLGIDEKRRSEIATELATEAYVGK